MQIGAMECDSVRLVPAIENTRHWIKNIVFSKLVF